MPGTARSFFGKKFWTVFLAFSKVFQKFLDSSSPPTGMSTFCNQLWLPVWRRRYRPAQLGVPEEAKKF